MSEREAIAYIEQWDVTEAAKVLKWYEDNELLRPCDCDTMIAIETESLRDENTKLREDLEFERSENGWAREFLNRMGQKCGTKDCPSLVAYVTKLEFENAKLRELVQNLRRVIPADVVGVVIGANTDHPSYYKFDEAFRELGIEVNA